MTNRCSTGLTSSRNSCLDVPVQLVRLRGPPIMVDSQEGSHPAEWSREEVDAHAEDEASSTGSKRRQYYNGKRRNTGHGRTGKFKQLYNEAVRPRRQRCVVDVEVTTGSGDRPRTTRRQVLEVPDKGRLELRRMGSITEDEVLRRWGRTVMDMMEAQYAAQLLG